jgi:hypothetical protein
LASKQNAQNNKEDHVSDTPKEVESYASSIMYATKDVNIWLKPPVISLFVVLTLASLSLLNISRRGPSYLSLIMSAITGLPTLISSILWKQQAENRAEKRFSDDTEATRHGESLH